MILQIASMHAVCRYESLKYLKIEYSQFNIGIPLQEDFQKAMQ